MADRTASVSVDVRRILAGAAAVLGSVVVAALAAWALIASWGGSLRARAPERPKVPAPVLEYRPLEDFSTYERHERQRLSSYGWVDRAAGTVHIPIEVAMSRLQQARAAAPAPAAPEAH